MLIIPVYRNNFVISSEYVLIERILVFGTASVNADKASWSSHNEHTRTNVRSS